MADPSSSSSPPAPSRGRGRGKSRGGLGKYLRARGRGGGRGRPAEWGQRLVLADEAQAALDAEEQAALEHRYARRQLGSNADRYVEPAPQLDSDGEEVVEPEVDLSAFLERQRLSGPAAVLPEDEEDDADIDPDLARIVARLEGKTQSKKGQVKQIEWDAQLEEMSREKAAAEATRDLKTRFRAQNARQRGKPTARGTGVGRSKAPERNYVNAPALPTDTPIPDKTEKEGMQDFLDDLLG